ncbi:MAG TPA: proline dehydrogenase family protein [Bacteroidales bacterium]|jgi:proline dehydrogenase|nr:proline dehydrogenase family protein [Bacteroidales bacterium]HOL97262.1 proline dehydrogenase family protein [Bacteroidales bacterium]HUM31597.1 proline dehydrogenase family protein [Bacteroidales bacterium]
MNFQNFNLAYRYKSKKELKNSLIVFKIITSPFLVSLGSSLIKIAQRLKLPLKPFTANIYKHFCGGESLDDVIALSEKLSKYGVKSIPDYSVEGQAEEESFSKLENEVLKTIKIAHNNPDIPFAVFKPTGLVNPELLTKDSDIQNPEFKKFIERFNRIFSYARELNVRVLVDAEDFVYQHKIDDTLLNFMKRYNKSFPVVFTTLQMYRTDRLDYLKFLLTEAEKNDFILGIKFVRGAYMEKERAMAKKSNYPDPIYKTKVETDNAYNSALKFAVENINRINIFCATHNEESTLYLISLIDTLRISHSDERIFFSQLYGMRDNISFALASEGFNVAKYIPYGPVNKVIPYLIRRAQENSSASSHSKSELAMLKEVLKNKNN